MANSSSRKTIGENMNNDFLVYWDQEEYIPNGTEQDDGEWSGEVIGETTFAIMRGDESLAIEEICTVNKVIYPASMPASYNDYSNKKYTVILDDVALIAFENYDLEYDSYSIGILRKSDRSLNFIIDDLTASAMVSIGLDASEITEANYIQYSNNSFIENGETHAWFYLSTNIGGGYFSINIDTGAVSLIRDNNNLYDKEVHIITESLTVYEAKFGVRRLDALFPRDEVVPVPIARVTNANGYILSISDDESQVLILDIEPEQNFYFYRLVDIYTLQETEIHFTDSPELTFLFIDFKEKIIAFQVISEYDNTLHIIYYNFNNEMICFWQFFNENLGPGWYFAERPSSEHLSYLNPKANAVFVNKSESRIIEIPAWGTDYWLVSSVIFPDGSNVIVEEKHPFLLGEGEYKPPADYGCLGMWSGGGSAQPKNFWTAFQYTQETI